MFELTVAWRYISSDLKMVLFTVLSVALAIGVIVVLTGVNEGYKNNLISSLVDHNPHITISPKENEDYITLYRTLDQIVSNYPQVEAVSPRLLGKAGAKYKDKVRSVSLIGADPLREDRLLNVQRDMVWGNYSELIYAKHAAVLGTKLADYLELKPGNEFTLIRQNKSMKLRVVGLIETGTGSDETLAYLPLATAQEILGEPDIVSEVGLRLYHIYDAPSIAADINRKTSYNAESWQQLNKDTLQVLDTQNLTLYLFYCLILIISGFGVANSMIVNVTRRTKDIGILLAMGTTRRSILKIFIIESLILGPPAALLGCALAYIIAMALNSFPIQIPSSDYNLVFRMEVFITYQNYLLAIIFALAVNLLSGIYPAYKASRLDPVEAIGSE